MDCGPDNTTFVNADGFCDINCAPNEVKLNAQCGGCIPECVCDLNGTFLENGTCSSCMDNCVRCDSSTSCHVCDQSNDYFLNNSRCSRCDLENCLKCESLAQCQTCDEENGFILDDSKLCVSSGLGVGSIVAIVLGVIAGVALFFFLGNFLLMQ